MDVKIQFSSEGIGSALAAALAYAGVRIITRVMTTLLPTSATLALLAALVWFAAALFLFVIVTWQRDDNWLAAGILIGSTLLCGGLVADVIASLVDIGSVGRALLATADASIGLLLRTIVIVPLSGGFVAGARWLTAEIRRNGAWT